MSVQVIDESRNVVKAARRGTITSLVRGAAYVRGIARRSISKRNTGKPNPPGKPPRSPTGRLRDSIAFDVDRARGEAVIGPKRSAIALIGRTHEFSGIEPAKRARGRGAKSARLQVGGAGPVRVESARRAKGKPRIVFAKLETQQQVARAKALIAEHQIPPSVTGIPSTASRRYPARPFMGPALRRSRDRLPSFWRNSVRG